MQNFDFRDAMNGTNGTLWLDGEEMSEVISFQAKEEYDKEEMRKAGSMIVGYQITGIKRKGSIKMHNADSNLIRKIGDMVERGITPRFTLVSKLANPSLYGAEEVQLSNVVFDDLTVADWELGVPGTIEAPFTYEGVKYLRLI